MKRMIAILICITLFLFSGLSPVSGQGTGQNSNLYKIQVGAFKSLKTAKLDSLFPLGDVYAEDAGNGMSRVVVGYFPDRATAENILPKVHKAGFSNAFVCSHNPSIKSEHISRISAESQDALNTQYLVVLGRFDDLKDVKLGTISRLSDMYVEEDNGKKKIVMGPFSDKQDAEATLAQVLENGFNDAILEPIVIPPSTSTKTPVSAKATPTEKKSESSTLSKANDSKKETVAAKLPSPSDTPSRPGTPINKPQGENVAPNQLYDTGQFFSFFTTPNFKVLHVPPYNPIVVEDKNTLPSSNSSADVKNRELKGNRLPDRLHYLFLQNLATDLGYFAVYRYSINTDFDGFVIRSGIDKYEEANETTLYIFDKTKMKFIGKELISAVQGKEGFFSSTESWLMDLNADHVPDLLSYTIEETNSKTKGYHKSSSFKARLWIDNKFVDAQIVNEEALRKQINIKD